MLSKRLQYLTEEVPAGAIVADIGCDHGYLLIELVNSGKIQCGFACDVNASPLQSAALNIAKYGYQDQLQTRLGSGVLALTEADSVLVDTLVVAGMGGALIRDIIAQSLGMPKLQTLILQPNIGAEIIREFLMDSAFELTKEAIIIDNDIAYPVLIYTKNDQHNQKWSPFEMLVGPFILQMKTTETKQYVTNLKNHWKHIVQQLQKSTNDQTEKIKEYETFIQQVEEWEHGDNR